MTGLAQDEQDIVDVGREFVDREVRPVARELEHANEYPGKLIGQMKQRPSTTTVQSIVRHGVAAEGPH